MAGMMYGLLYFYSCFLFRWTAARLQGGFREHSDLKKYSDAISLNDIDGVKKIADTQKQLTEELRKLVDSIKEEQLHSNNLKGRDAVKHSSGKMKDIIDNDFKMLADAEFPEDAEWVYEMANLYQMEAPVIYMTPPAISPGEQLEASAEVESLLMNTGLDGKPKGLSDDDEDDDDNPYQLTSLADVKAAIRSCKQEIDHLRKKRDELWKKIKNISIQLATDRSKLFLYRATRKDLTVYDRRLEDEAIRLTKLQQVKSSLIKKDVASAEADEDELENREKQLINIGDDVDDDAKQPADL